MRDETIAIHCFQEGVFRRTLNYTNAHPWLWAVYVLVQILILTYFFVLYH